MTEDSEPKDARIWSPQGIADIRESLATMCRDYTITARRGHTRKGRSVVYADGDLNQTTILLYNAPLVIKVLLGRLEKAGLLPTEEAGTEPEKKAEERA